MVVTTKNHKAVITTKNLQCQNQHLLLLQVAPHHPPKRLVSVQPCHKNMVLQILKAKVDHWPLLKNYAFEVFRHKEDAGEDLKWGGWGARLGKISNVGWLQIFPGQIALSLSKPNWSWWEQVCDGPNLLFFLSLLQSYLIILQLLLGNSRRQRSTGFSQIIRMYWNKLQMLFQPKAMQACFHEALSKMTMLIIRGHERISCHFS